MSEAPPSRTRVWVLASRPKTLPAAIAPVLLGSAIAWHFQVFHLLSALAAMVGALLIQIGTNFANDYYDGIKGTDTGERLGPLRVTHAGYVTPAVMKRATALVFALAILVGVNLVVRGGWPIVIIGLSSVLFGYLYTAGPYPLSYNGLSDPFVLFFFGPVAVGGTFYVQAQYWSPEAIIAGLGPGLFSVAILTVNNLRDIHNDRKAGKKTLPARFGPGFAQGEYLSSVVFAMLVPIALWLRYDTPVWTLLALLSMVAAIKPIRATFTIQGRELNNTLADTGKALLLYCLLFSIGWVIG